MHADGFLQAPGARLFYRVSGFGPPLLILSGGEADADMVERLQCELLDRFRVITFDRRGLSRSGVEEGSTGPSIDSHAEDARALVEQVAKEPAFVFGSSIGGLVGLELLSAYPQCLRRLVVHEAPTAELLGPDEEARMRAAQAEMQVLFRREGLRSAMRMSARLAGSDPEDREPDVEPPELTPQRERNLAFLMTYDVPAVRRYQLDRAALRASARKIIPAAGAGTRGTLLHHCAAALARAVGRPLVEMPGGHTGWLMRPAAFAAALAALFDDREAPAQREWDDRPAGDERRLN
jgi:pimeloyl-ACP methyl ester carboxylesterase